MTKLNKKIFISISIVVISVSILSLTINHIFVDKYYLHKKKEIINSLGYKLEDMDLNYLLSNISEIENLNDAIVVYMPLYADYIHMSEHISSTLNNEFNKKGIALKKFWISDDLLLQLNKGSINKIYNQGESTYSLLVKLMIKDNYLFAIGSPIEHSEETIKIVNRFNIILNGFSVILITIITFVLSNKITRPLHRLKVLSSDISKLNFRTEDIKTHDEIEELSESINTMCINLEKAHNELNNKNKNLKRFIADASHELKTPAALIKAYAIGVQDGIDDGTFLNTIVEQSDNLTKIINDLLYWAKYEKKEITINKFDLKDTLLESLEGFNLIFEENNIDVNLKLDDGYFPVSTDEESIKIVLNNLITNAIKYTTDKRINISLLKSDEKIFFSVVNSVNDISVQYVNDFWKPFMVLEESRNKSLSGTGLGLSIVKDILTAHKLEHDARLFDDKIEFYVIFNINKSQHSKRFS